MKTTLKDNNERRQTNFENKSTLELSLAQVSKKLNKIYLFYISFGCYFNRTWEIWLSFPIYTMRCTHRIYLHHVDGIVLVEPSRSRVICSKLQRGFVVHFVHGGSPWRIWQNQGHTRVFYIWDRRLDVTFVGLWLTVTQRVIVIQIRNLLILTRIRISTASKAPAMKSSQLFLSSFLSFKIICKLSVLRFKKRAKVTRVMEVKNHGAISSVLLSTNFLKDKIYILNIQLSSLWIQVGSSLDLIYPMDQSKLALWFKKTKIQCTIKHTWQTITLIKKLCLLRRV